MTCAFIMGVFADQHIYHTDSESHREASTKINIHSLLKQFNRERVSHAHKHTHTHQYRTCTKSLQRNVQELFLAIMDRIIMQSVIFSYSLPRNLVKFKYIWCISKKLFCKKCVCIKLSKYNQIITAKVFSHNIFFVIVVTCSLGI